MLLNKVVKENKVRNLNFKFKHHASDLKTSMCALKETLISWSHRTHIAENVMQNVVLWVAKLKTQVELSDLQDSCC